MKARYVSKILKALWQIVKDSHKNATIWAFWQKAAIDHIFPIFISSHSKFWAIYVFNNFVKIKSIGLYNFLKQEQNVANEHFFFFFFFFYPGGCV